MKLKFCVLVTCDLIYTDGSKLDDGSVGCAFCIPDLNITKRYKLNSDVSIVSAELYAIYMALSFIVDCPRNIQRVVVITDSKASLQAIKSMSDNRQDLILDINHLSAELLQRGTFLDMLWVPSHSGISGNDMADRAAKQAASGYGQTTLVDVGYTKSECTARLKTAAWKMWKDRFLSEVANRSWPMTEIPTVYHPPPFRSVYHQQLFHRLRCCTPRFHYSKIECPCGQHFSYTHLFSCPSIWANLPKTKGLLTEYGLLPTPSNLLFFHPKIDWSLAKTFILELSESNFAYAY